MKRLIALLLALIFSLTILAGCAKKEEPQTEEPAATEQAAPAETTTADTTGGGQ